MANDPHTDWATMCNNLKQVIAAQQQLINQIATHLEQIEIGGGGGGGTASIEDYESGKLYKRNMLLVDTDTETVYRVLATQYTSVTVQTDVENQNLKVVGLESQIVTFDHDPSQAEIEGLPDDSFVAVYSTTDDPYHPQS
jgi:hypothetical protein